MPDWSLELEFSLQGPSQTDIPLDQVTDQCPKAGQREWAELKHHVPLGLLPSPVDAYKELKGECRAWHGCAVVFVAGQL